MIYNFLEVRLRQQHNDFSILSILKASHLFSRTESLAGDLTGNRNLSWHYSVGVISHIRKKKKKIIPCVHENAEILEESCQKEFILD